MPGLRLNPPGPFWLEDLMFLVIDEGRRLPARAARAASVIGHLLKNAAAFDPASLLRRLTGAGALPRPAALPRRDDVPPLEEPEVWALATEPLVTADTGAHAAIALHRAASERLDALTYVLNGMRDELRPIMTYARFSDDKVYPLQTAAALDTSIGALLELSRRNAATRPKDRVRPAA